MQQQRPPSNAYQSAVNSFDNAFRATDSIILLTSNISIQPISTSPVPSNSFDISISNTNDNLLALSTSNVSNTSLNLSSLNTNDKPLTLSTLNVNDNNSLILPEFTGNLKFLVTDQFVAAQFVAAQFVAHSIRRHSIRRRYCM